MSEGREDITVVLVSSAYERFVDIVREQQLISPRCDDYSSQPVELVARVVQLVLGAPRLV